MQLWNKQKKCNNHLQNLQPKQTVSGQKKSIAYINNAYKTKTTRRQSANNVKEAKPAKKTQAHKPGQRRQSKIWENEAQIKIFKIKK